MAFWILLLPQTLLADDSCSAASAGECAASLLQLKLKERKEHALKSAVEDGAAHAAHREARARAALDATFWWKSGPSKEDEDELDSTVKGKGSAPEHADDAEEGGEGNETLSEDEEAEGNETLSDEEEAEGNATLSEEEEGESEGEEDEEEKDAYLEEMEHAKAEDVAQEKIEEAKEAERHEEELEAAEESAEMDEVNPEAGHEEHLAAEVKSEEPEEPASEIEAAHEEHEPDVDEESASNAESETAHTEAEDEVKPEEHPEELAMVSAHGEVPARSKAGRSRGGKHTHANKPIRRTPVGDGPTRRSGTED